MRGFEVGDRFVETPLLIGVELEEENPVDRAPIGQRNGELNHLFGLLTFEIVENSSAQIVLAVVVAHQEQQEVVGFRHRFHLGLAERRKRELLSSIGEPLAGRHLENTQTERKVLDHRADAVEQNWRNSFLAVSGHVVHQQFGSLADWHVVEFRLQVGCLRATDIQADS